MKRLLWILVLIFVCLAFLMGCKTTTTSTNSLTEETSPATTEAQSMELIAGEGDEAYLRLYNVEPYPDGYDVFYLYWADLVELRDAILSEKLTPEQLPFVIRFRKNVDGNYRIYNPNAMHQPILPTDLEARGVYWNGESYQVEWSYDADLSKKGFGFVTFYTESLYREYFDAAYTHCMDGFTIVSQETVEDRNATQTVIKKGQSEKKILRYTIPKAEGSVLIQEEYTLSNSNPSESELAPSKLELFCETPGAFFAITMFNLEERPSVEWLSSFGAEPLATSEDTEDTVDSTKPEEAPTQTGTPVTVTQEDISAYMKNEGSFRQGKYSFLVTDDSHFLVVESAGNDSQTVSRAERFTDFEAKPSDERFSQIEPDMTVFDVSGLVGMPLGEFTSGMISLDYESNTGERYRVYWKSDMTVQEVILISENK